MGKIRAGHLEFLDGIRGLSAFYVLLTHAYNALFYVGIKEQGQWAHLMMVLLKPLAFGRYAVDMFIVLSGYCLMLPVVRSGTLRGGFLSYIKRRATRILPTYYAALAFSVLILVFRGTWLQPTIDGAARFGHWPALGDLMSHLLLVHNLFENWAHGINSPMWSVASEWQIYFFFPALLLPVWRRGGATAAVIVAFIIGYSLFLLVPGGLETAAPWYLGLFALGMAAATLNHSVSDIETGMRGIPWRGVFVGLMAVLIVTGTLAGGWFRDHAWLVDPVFGLAATSLIIHCANTTARSGADAPDYLLKILQSRCAAVLGAFSYSLYLIHYPLIELAASGYRFFRLSANLQIALTFGVCVPVVGTLAYLFHVVFERPFMPGQPRNIRQAQVAAEIAPAP